MLILAFGSALRCKDKKYDRIQDLELNSLRIYNRSAFFTQGDHICPCLTLITFKFSASCSACGHKVCLWLCQPHHTVEATPE